MPSNTADSMKAWRLLVIAALLCTFTGGIVYSVQSIRYDVDGKPTSEFTVTKLSLTHEVEPAGNGKFTNPWAESMLPGSGSMTVAKAGNTPIVLVAAARSTAVSKDAVKKPAPKKPAPKKPAPKKPAPKKKPEPKKPKPKACPT